MQRDLPLVRLYAASVMTCPDGGIVDVVLALDLDDEVAAVRAPN